MIQLQGVTKDFAGPIARVRGRRVRALDEMNLSVEAGSALGVIGPNGAGKSTLIRLLLGYLRPTSGRVTVANLAPREYTERYGVGYVPERIEIPTRWSSVQALSAYAALGETEDPHGRAEALLEKLGLTSLAHRRVSALSKGNLQKLAIAQALLAPRRLLILDEPTDGIDPEWTARVREILADWRADDPERVIIFASHHLDEVERICDRAAVLSEGRLREIVELGDDGPALRNYRLELEGEIDMVSLLVDEIFPDAIAEKGPRPTFILPAADLPELNRRLRDLLASGGIIRSLSPERADLERRFRQSLEAGGEEE